MAATLADAAEVMRRYEERNPRPEGRFFAGGHRGAAFRHIPNEPWHWTYNGMPKEQVWCQQTQTFDDTGWPAVWSCVLRINHSGGCIFEEGLR